MPEKEEPCAAIPWLPLPDAAVVGADEDSSTVQAPAMNTTQNRAAITA